MSKYIKNYSQILNENSVGSGSVLLILGKPNSSGLRKVYATQIKGAIEIKPGVRRFFLGDVFYIIKFIDGAFKIIKIDYRTHDDLKKELSIKAPGNISIVQHYNKTPFHKRTLKYTDIHRALSDIKFDLLGENYLLESGESNQTENNEFFHFSNIIIEKVFDTAFLGEPNCKIVDYHIDDTIEREVDRVLNTELNVDWDIEFKTYFKELEIREFLQKYDMNIIPLIVFSLNSDISLEDVRGDNNWAIVDCETKLYECYIDGYPVKLTEELELKINEFINNYDYHDTIHTVGKNLSKHHLIKLKNS